MSHSLSLFDRVFLVSLVALMWVAVVFWSASLSEKFTPLLTTTSASLMVIEGTPRPFDRASITCEHCSRFFDSEEEEGLQPC